MAQPRLYRLGVHAEPARAGRGRRLWIDGDHLQVGPAEQAQQAIVRAHARVRTAWLGRHAKCVGDVLRPRGKRGGGDHEMVEGDCHCVLMVDKVVGTVPIQLCRTFSVQWREQGNEQQGSDGARPQG